MKKTKGIILRVILLYLFVISFFGIVIYQIIQVQFFQASINTNSQPRYEIIFATQKSTTHTSRKFIREYGGSS